MREFSHAFELPIGRDKVFPLFTPKGEEAWVPGWKPNFLQPKSGETGRGMVFTTIEASGATAIWTCLDYIPLAGIARYFRVIADRRASIVEVTCTEVNSKRTIVRVSYQHVPLTPEGNAEIEALDEGEFRRDIQGLRNLVMPLLNAA